MLLGGYNSEPSQNVMIEFCKVHKLKNLVDGATFYKNPEKCSCIDLILTNGSRSSQRYHIIKNGPSDFNRIKDFSHINRITDTFMKLYF